MPRLSRGSNFAVATKGTNPKTGKVAPKIDKNPPGEIKIINTIVDVDTITFEWENPFDADFQEVEIYLNDEIYSVVNKDITTFTKNDLEKNKKYKFKFVTVDESKNKSKGLIKYGYTRKKIKDKINIETNIISKMIKSKIFKDKLSLSSNSNSRSFNTRLATGKLSLRTNTIDNGYKTSFIKSEIGFNVDVSGKVANHVDKNPPGEIFNIISIKSYDNIRVIWDLPHDNDIYRIIIYKNNLKYDIVDNETTEYTFTKLNENTYYKFGFIVEDTSGNQSDIVNIYETTSIRYTEKIDIKASLSGKIFKSSNKNIILDINTYTNLNSSAYKTTNINTSANLISNLYKANFKTANINILTNAYGYRFDENENMLPALFKGKINSSINVNGQSYKSFKENTLLNINTNTSLVTFHNLIKFDSFNFEEDFNGKDNVDSFNFSIFNPNDENYTKAYVVAGELSSSDPSYEYTYYLNHHEYNRNEYININNINNPSGGIDKNDILIGVIYYDDNDTELKKEFIEFVMPPSWLLTDVYLNSDEENDHINLFIPKLLHCDLVKLYQAEDSFYPENGYNHITDIIPNETNQDKWIKESTYYDGTTRHFKLEFYKNGNMIEVFERDFSW